MLLSPLVLKHNSRNTIGTQNTAIGYTTRTHNTAVGFTSGTQNTAVGLIYIKLVLAIGLSPTSGYYNTAIGKTTGD